MDARRYLRFRVQVPATLRLGGASAVCHGRTLVVSCGGMEVVCDGNNLSCLLPQGHRITPDTRAVLEFALSLSADQGSVKGSGRVLNARRLAQDQFSLGFEILHLEPRDETRLTEFLDHCTPTP